MHRTVLKDFRGRSVFYWHILAVSNMTRPAILKASEGQLYRHPCLIDLGISNRVLGLKESAALHVGQA